MREWPNRAVSKTVVSQGTVGSNPTPSAKVKYKSDEVTPMVHYQNAPWV